MLHLTGNASVSFVHQKPTYVINALGSSQNVYSWTKVRENEVVVNDSELTLVDLMASDGGQYQCLVENPAGRGNANITLNGEIRL